MDKTIKTFLETHSISYQHHEHAATHTVKDSEKICKGIDGLRLKNLFLTDGTKHYLIIMPGDKRLDIKLLEKTLSAKKLTFAPASDLHDLLQTQPGHVSPFALLFDTTHSVKAVIDEDAWNAEVLNFHPGINTETIVVPKNTFHTLIKTLTKKYLILPL